METDVLSQLFTLWATADIVTRIILVLLALHPVASFITSVTTTPNDDTWYGFFYNKILRPLALNKGLATQAPPSEEKKEG